MSDFFSKMGIGGGPHKVRGVKKLNRAQKAFKRDRKKAIKRFKKTGYF